MLDDAITEPPAAAPPSAAVASAATSAARLLSFSTLKKSLISECASLLTCGIVRELS